jgi:hypothetical protein
LGIKRRLEQLEAARQARQARRIAALDRLLGSLPPEEAVILEATLEAEMIGLPIPPDIEQQADIAFARAWRAVTPDERALLTSSTIAEAWRTGETP